MRDEHPQVSRRRFILGGGVGLATMAVELSNTQVFAEPDNNPTVMTVKGPIRAEDMGITLTHEHVLVDFIGAEEFSPNRYDSNQVFKTVLPHLLEPKSLGCQTFIECTPAHLGRDLYCLDDSHYRQD